MPPVLPPMLEMQEAFHRAIEEALADENSFATVGVPRVTKFSHRLQNWNSLLSESQEQELCRRIFRLVETGMPLSNDVLRRSVCSFADENFAVNSLLCPSPAAEVITKQWMENFYRRYPVVARLKEQELNVIDYFRKLENAMLDLNLTDRPQLVYNLAERGCHLNLINGWRRDASRPSRVDNFTVLACANALGETIPPMVFFREKLPVMPFWKSLPPGTAIETTSECGFTTTLFGKWVDHFAKYKPTGGEPCLLIFDGAQSYLDANIVACAEANGISLVCVPRDTGPILQPLYKSLLSLCEDFWDEQVTKYGSPSITSNRRFGLILHGAWVQAMSPARLAEGFRTTGVYPFNPAAVPDCAFEYAVLDEDEPYLVEDERDTPEERRILKEALSSPYTLSPYAQPSPTLTSLLHHRIYEARNDRPPHLPTAITQIDGKRVWLVPVVDGKQGGKGKPKKKRKRVRMVPVDSVEVDDSEGRKKYLPKLQRGTNKSAHIGVKSDSSEKDVCVLFTNFTSDGDYINDHDYLINPYFRNKMLVSRATVPGCMCLLCDMVHPDTLHIEHMQCHGTKCAICLVDFHNVFILNLHVRAHTSYCIECKVNVTYTRYRHHAETHNKSASLSHIDLPPEFPQLVKADVQQAPTTVDACAANKIEAAGNSVITEGNLAPSPSQQRRKRTRRKPAKLQDELLRGDPGFSVINEIDGAADEDAVAVQAAAGNSVKGETAGNLAPPQQKRKRARRTKAEIMHATSVLPGCSVLKKRDGADDGLRRSRRMTRSRYFGRAEVEEEEACKYDKSTKSFVTPTFEEQKNLLASCTATKDAEKNIEASIENHDDKYAETNLNMQFVNLTSLTPNIEGGPTSNINITFEPLATGDDMAAAPMEDNGKIMETNKNVQSIPASLSKNEERRNADDKTDANDTDDNAESKDLSDDIQAVSKNDADDGKAVSKNGTDDKDESNALPKEETIDTTATISQDGTSHTSFSGSWKKQYRRAQWCEKNLHEALEAIDSGMPVFTASVSYNIPRWTLRTRLGRPAETRALLRTNTSTSSTNPWTEESFQQALQAIRDGMNQYLAASIYGIPRTSLRSRLFRERKQAKQGHVRKVRLEDKEVEDSELGEEKDMDTGTVSSADDTEGGTGEDEAESDSASKLAVSDSSNVVDSAGPENAVAAKRSSARTRFPKSISESSSGTPKHEDLTKKSPVRRRSPKNISESSIGTTENKASNKKSSTRKRFPKSFADSSSKTPSLPNAKSSTSINKTKIIQRKNTLQLLKGKKLQVKVNLLTKSHSSKPQKIGNKSKTPSMVKIKSRRLSTGKTNTLQKRKVQISNQASTKGTESDVRGDLKMKIKGIKLNPFVALAGKKSFESECVEEVPQIKLEASQNPKVEPVGRKKKRDQDDIDDGLKEQLENTQTIISDQDAGGSSSATKEDSQTPKQSTDIEPTNNASGSARKSPGKTDQQIPSRSSSGTRSSRSRGSLNLVEPLKIDGAWITRRKRKSMPMVPAGFNDHQNIEDVMGTKLEISLTLSQEIAEISSPAVEKPLDFDPSVQEKIDETTVSQPVIEIEETSAQRKRVPAKTRKKLKSMSSVTVSTEKQDTDILQISSPLSHQEISETSSPAFEKLLEIDPSVQEKINETTVSQPVIEIEEMSAQKKRVPAKTRKNRKSMSSVTVSTEKQDTDILQISPPLSQEISETSSPAVEKPLEIDPSVQEKINETTVSKPVIELEETSVQRKRVPAKTRKNRKSMSSVTVSTEKQDNDLLQISPPLSQEISETSSPAVEKPLEIDPSVQEKINETTVSKPVIELEETSVQRKRVPAKTRKNRKSMSSVTVSTEKQDNDLLQISPPLSQEISETSSPAVEKPLEIDPSVQEKIDETIVSKPVIELEETSVQRKRVPAKTRKNRKSMSSVTVSTEKQDTDILQISSPLRHQEISDTSSPTVEKPLEIDPSVQEKIVETTVSQPVIEIEETSVQRKRVPAKTRKNRKSMSSVTVSTEKQNTDILQISPPLSQEISETSRSPAVEKPLEIDPSVQEKIDETTVSKPVIEIEETSVQRKLVPAKTRKTRKSMSSVTVSTEKQDTDILQISSPLRHQEISDTSSPTVEKPLEIDPSVQEKIVETTVSQPVIEIEETSAQRKRVPAKTRKNRKSMSSVTVPTEKQDTEDMLQISPPLSQGSSEEPLEINLSVDAEATMSKPNDDKDATHESLALARESSGNLDTEDMKGFEPQLQEPLSQQSSAEPSSCDVDEKSLEMDSSVLEATVSKLVEIDDTTFRRRRSPVKIRKHRKSMALAHESTENQDTEDMKGLEPQLQEPLSRQSSAEPSLSQQSDVVEKSLEMDSCVLEATVSKSVQIDNASCQRKRNPVKIRKQSTGNLDTEDMKGLEPQLQEPLSQQSSAESSSCDLVEKSLEMDSSVLEATVSKLVGIDDTSCQTEREEATGAEILGSTDGTNVAQPLENMFGLPDEEKREDNID